MIEELTRNREQVMQKMRASVMERQKLIFLNKDLMTEHRQLANGTGNNDSVFVKIAELEESNKKLVAENSELVKENYLMQEEKEELAASNEKLKKKSKTK